MVRRKLLSVDDVVHSWTFGSWVREENNNTSDAAKERLRVCCETRHVRHVRQLNLAIIIRVKWKWTVRINMYITYSCYWQFDSLLTLTKTCSIQLAGRSQVQVSRSRYHHIEDKLRLLNVSTTADKDDYVWRNRVGIRKFSICSQQSDALNKLRLIMTSKTCTLYGIRILCIMPTWKHTLWQVHVCFVFIKQPEFKQEVCTQFLRKKLLWVMI